MEQVYFINKPMKSVLQSTPLTFIWKLFHLNLKQLSRMRRLFMVFLSPSRKMPTFKQAKPALCKVHTYLLIITSSHLTKYYTTYEAVSSLK
jgi:hypothetical protein